MANATIDKRIRAVLLYIDGVKEAKEICTIHGIPVRTFRRWVSAYRKGGVDNLKPKKPGPVIGTSAIPEDLEERIIQLKQKHPSWGARRIKYQYDLPCCWRTVHRVIKRHQMLIRIKPKPQPPVKRFQRKHVDSMWQGDSFQSAFRASGRPMLQDSQTTVRDIASSQKYIFTREQMKQSTRYALLCQRGESQEKSISTTQSSSRRRSLRQSYQSITSSRSMASRIIQEGGER